MRHDEHVSNFQGNVSRVEQLGDLTLADTFYSPGFRASYAKMHQAIRALVKCAVDSGDIRKDLDPVDLLHVLVGVANVAARAVRTACKSRSLKRKRDTSFIGSVPIDVSRYDGCLLRQFRGVRNGCEHQYRCEG
jgi:hypothetical protein